MNTLLKILLALLPMFLAQVSHSDGDEEIIDRDYEEIAKQDISGMWSLGHGDGYVALYEDKKMTWWDANCNVISKGTWKFEMAGLRIYADGEEKVFTMIIKIPRRLRNGSVMTVDTGRDWMFLGTDTSKGCD